MDSYPKKTDSIAAKQQMNQKNSMKYEDAGVSIHAGNAFVKAIAPFAQQTQRPGSQVELGGFGAFFDPKAAKFQDPLLVAATDGVGTKLRLAITYDDHEKVGIDLVAMCVNDLIVQGAEPLFFLDYFATGKLETDIALRVVQGISQGCQQANCALIGGETAEMPGMYAQGDYDLAGFAVGAVERGHQLTGKTIQEEDVLIGLASSGIHANGFSLVRHILTEKNIQPENEASFDKGQSLASVLLTPTRIYVKNLIPLIQNQKIKALAHVTGGGLLENIPRVLPNGLCARIQAHSWELPCLFTWLQEQGNITAYELGRTFNCGIGMVLIVAPDTLQEVTQTLHSVGEKHSIIGEIIPGKRGCVIEGVADSWGQKQAWKIHHDA